MTAPTPAAKAPPPTFNEFLIGGLCLFLIGWYIYAGISNFFSPARSERLKSPMRDTRNSEEKQIRLAWENVAHSAVWNGNQATEFPLQILGTELKSVSAINPHFAAPASTS